MRPSRAALALPALVLASSLGGFGCDDKKHGAPPQPSAAPASPASVAAILGLDAGLLTDNVDPPAPAGELKVELERFVNVETCVRERANVDPLVGDALRAIGYDTFLRDACRLLEAAKDKKRETCDRIDSSALRARCQSWVAMVAQTPEACPLRFEGVPTRGRNVSCLAIAGKDARLCAGEARTATRATCEALVARDDAKCNSLLTSDQAACKREVVRWRSLLDAPLGGLAALPTPKGKLVVKGESGTPDPPTSEADLASELARGAVVVTSRDRARVELGMLGESETTRMAPSPNRRPRLGVAVIFEPASPASSVLGGSRTGDKDVGLKPLLERLELEIPGHATLVHPTSRCECRITTARIDKSRGGEVAIALQGTIGTGDRHYKVDVELTTFVRDVVPEQAGTIGVGRVLPPVHPSLSATSALSPTPALSVTPR